MAVLGCGDYQIDLPNGYQLIRVASGEVAIAEPQGGPYGQRMLIDADVDGYAIIGQYIVGHARVPDSPEGPPTETRQSAAYFLLDSSNGSVSETGSREEWLVILRSNGIDQEPDLLPPTRPMN